MKKFFPILSWLPAYPKAWLAGDISAGLTVGFMLIPQGMAYALLAGMPPIYGLYTSIFPPLIYAVMGTSRALSVGPVAIDSLLVASGVGMIAAQGSPEYIALAIALALLLGLMQFLAGMLRLGFLVNFVSQPVISGFTSAAAVVISLSQLSNLLGISIPRADYVYQTLALAAERIHQVHWPTVLFSLGGMALVLGLRKWKRSFPGALVAVVASILVMEIGGLATWGIKTIGSIPSGLPMPALPQIGMEEVNQLLPTALTLVLVAFMEAYSVGKAMQIRRKDPDIQPNQELRALGMANVVGSFFLCFPAAGGFSRSAVNDQSGAKTGLATMISSVFVLLTLLFLTPFLQNLPQAILASIIMVAVIGLVDLKLPKKLWKTDRTDFFLLVATFLATIGFGIMPGIGAGVALSLGVLIFRSAYPHMAILGQLPQSRYFRNVERFPEAIVRKDVLVARLDSQLFFANASNFRDWICAEANKKGKELRLLVLDCEAMGFIDSSGQELLRNLRSEMEGKGVAFYLSGVRGPVRDALFRSGLGREFGGYAIHVHTSEAVEAWDARSKGVESEGDSRAIQFNQGKK